MQWKPLTRSALKSLSLTHLEVAMVSCKIAVIDMVLGCTRAMHTWDNSVAMRTSNVSAASLPIEGWGGSRATFANFICRRSTVNNDICAAREKDLELLLALAESGHMGGRGGQLMLLSITRMPFLG